MFRPYRAIGDALTVALAMIMFLGPAPASGAWPAPALRLSLGSAYTSNLFQDYAPRSDWVHSIGMAVDHAFGDVQVGYYGDARMYATYDDLFALTHALVVSVVRPGPDRQLWVAGLTASMRSGRHEYEYRDYYETDGYLGIRRYLQPTLMLRAGVTGVMRRYQSASAYSYFEPAAYVQLSRFLQTRTTLQAGIDTGAKLYLDDVTGEPLYSAYTRAADTGRQVQATIWAKVAQSIGPRSGLQVRLSHQDLLTGLARYEQPAMYDPVQELFDDGYSYAGQQIRAVLKHRGAAGLELLFMAQHERRTYEGRPPLDLEGLPVAEGGDRRDRRTGVLLRAERPLTWATRAVDAAAVRLEWSLTTVASNDPYYEAATQNLSAEIHLDL